MATTARVCVFLFLFLFLQVYTAIFSGAMHVVVGVAINIYALREELTPLSSACLAAYTECSPLLHTIPYFQWH